VLYRYLLSLEKDQERSVPGPYRSAKVEQSRLALQTIQSDNLRSIDDLAAFMCNIFFEGKTEVMPNELHINLLVPSRVDLTSRG
jgi:hypothetical protein